MSTKRLNTEIYIKRLKDKHGDRYDYSNVVYVNRRTKVTIVCRQHGTLEVLPLAFLEGMHGCAKCGYVSMSRKQPTAKAKGSYKWFCTKSYKINSTKLLEDLKSIHDNKYKYSDLSYKNKEKDYITIICPIHGEFTQAVRSHLMGQGCKKCGITKATESKITPFSMFAAKAVTVHKDKYTYSEKSYTNYSTKTDIFCKKCGKVFRMVPDAHVNQSQDCPYCRGMYRTITDLISIVADHNLSIELLPGPIQNSSTLVSIYCKEHGISTRSVKDLVAGRGCYECSKGGFRPNKPGILYYVSIAGGTAYKFGITNQTVERRFMGESVDVKTLRTWYFDDGKEALLKEKELLTNYNEYKYLGPNLLRTGNTELLSYDVLGLDIQI